MTVQRYNPDNEQTFSNSSPSSESERSSLDLAQTKRKIMDYVAARNHTETELRKKLSARCDEETLEQAMTWAKQQNWLAASDELTENFADQLNRRGKGIHQINKKLEELGLNTIAADPENELQKATKLALAKWSANQFEDLDSADAKKLKIKIMRFLAGRGFDEDIITSILENEFKAGALSHDDEY